MIDKKEARILMSQLIALVKVDDEAHKQELELLIGIGRLLEISKDEIIELFKRPEKFSPPKSEFDRILQFHRMILMINVDKMVTSQELQLVREQGIAMGLHNQQIDAVLNEMRKYENNMIPPDKMVEIFKVYNN